MEDGRSRKSKSARQPEPLAPHRNGLARALVRISDHPLAPTLLSNFFKRARLGAVIERTIGHPASDAIALNSANPASTSASISAAGAETDALASVLSVSVSVSGASP
jgi:hypothetical protein